MNNQPMPQVIERFADNGEHSHYILIDDEGRTLWSEDPDDVIHPAPTSHGDEGEDEAQQTATLQAECERLMEGMALILKGASPMSNCNDWELSKYGRDIAKNIINTATAALKGKG